MKTLFITATGTATGKTYVAAALAQALTAKGKSVRVLKPVISGFDENGDGADFKDTDTALLLAAVGLAPTKEAVDACSPWRFKQPLSPDMAAKREGRDIDVGELVRFCRDAQANNEGGGGDGDGDGDGDILLIEGIGGVMVPLSDTHTVVDWIAAVGRPTLVVAGSYLGTLSHTLTSIAALQGRHINIAGVVVVESEESPAPITETVETLRRHLSGVAVAAVPRNAEPEEVLEALAEMTGL